MKSEPNIYYFRKLRFYMLVYVDDVVLVGDQPQRLFDQLSKKITLKKTGTLAEGLTVKFLGRRLRMRNGVIEMYTPEDYLKGTFKDFGLKGQTSRCAGCRDYADA